MDTLDATPNPIPPASQPVPSPPSADPPANPITSTAPVQMPPVSVPPAQGKLQLWLVSWFGASYETTIPGYVSGIGGVLMAIGAAVGPTSPLGIKLLAIGGALMGIGTQQGLQRSKSTKVTGAEPNK